MRKKITWYLVMFCAFYVCSVSSVWASSAGLDELMERAEQRRIAIAKMMESSTVFVLGVDESNGDAGFGTGFVVAPGYVLTNGHVTDGFSTIYVSGSTFKMREATVVKEINDDLRDFAVLKFSLPADVPVLTFNLNNQRTDRVSAWGYPGVVSQFDNRIDQILAGDFDGTPPLVYTSGAISSFVNNGETVSIVHSATIASGNSGGPLINAKGEVIGINTWRGTDVNEGTMVNAALTAKDAIAFLRSCGVEPRISSGGNYVAQAPPQSQQSPPPAGNDSSPRGGGRGGRGGLQLPGYNAPSPQGPDLGGLYNSVAAVSGDNPQETPAPKANTTGLSKEMQDMLKLAESGDADAQAYMGISYYEGDEAPEDPDLGVSWLKKAVENGSVDAKAMLGVVQISDPMYQDTKQGLKNLEQAAKGDANYASILSYFLYAGETLGIKRDFDTSYELAKRGAKVNDPDAIALLAMFYHSGLADKQDRVKALEFANKAAKDDIALAYAVLSWLYFMGEGGAKQDNAKAFEYAQMAADGDDSEGMALLSYFYFEGIGAGKDQKKALSWATSATEAGNDFGRFLLGMFYVEGNGVKKNLPLGLAYLKLAHDAGYNDASELYEKYLPELSKIQLEESENYVRSWYAQWGF